VTKNRGEGGEEEKKNFPKEIEGAVRKWALGCTRSNGKNQGRGVCKTGAVLHTAQPNQDQTGKRVKKELSRGGGEKMAKVRSSSHKDGPRCDKKAKEKGGAGNGGGARKKKGGDESKKWGIVKKTFTLSTSRAEEKCVRA